MTHPFNVRRLGFWVADALTGKHVARQLGDIEKLFGNPQETRNKKNQRISYLLDHACRTTAFYRKFTGSKSLTDFPVMNKTTIREHFSDFISSDYRLDTLSLVTTSGSYGTPCRFYFTKEKKARQTAEIIFFSRWAGLRVGDRHAQIRIRDRSKRESFLKNQVLMNPLHPDNEWLEKQREILLKDKKTKVLVGYSSTITALANYCSNIGSLNDKYHLKGIIYTAEHMNESAVEIIESTFGARVLGRYCTSELGVLAHQCPRNKKYHINNASYHIELLSLNSDRPATAGALGRVVVTDLFSHALPLIRYDTGDLAVLSDSECSCGIGTPALERLDGRQREIIYDTKGRKVRIHRAIEYLEGVIQYQFIQTGEKEYVINLSVLPFFNKEPDIKSSLIDVLGKDANISFCYVSTIQPLPSGKRPFIINVYRASV